MTMTLRATAERANKTFQDHHLRSPKYKISMSLSTSKYENIYLCLQTVPKRGVLSWSLILKL